MKILPNVKIIYIKIAYNWKLVYKGNDMWEMFDNKGIKHDNITTEYIRKCLDNRWYSKITKSEYENYTE